MLMRENGAWHISAVQGFQPTGLFQYRKPYLSCLAIVRVMLIQQLLQDLLWITTKHGNKCERKDNTNQQDLA